MALQAIRACCYLANDMGLEGSDAFRAAAGTRLVLGAGRVSLVRLSTHLAGSGGSDFEWAALGQAVTVQTEAMLAAMILVGGASSDLADCTTPAALASTSAPRIAPWLATVSRALLLLDGRPGGLASLLVRGEGGSWECSSCMPA